MEYVDVIVDALSGIDIKKEDSEISKPNPEKEDLDALYEDIKVVRGYSEELEKDAFVKFFNDLSDNTKLNSCIAYLQSGDKPVSLDLLSLDEITICPLDFKFANIMLEKAL